MKYDHDSSWDIYKLSIDKRIVCNRLPVSRDECRVKSIKDKHLRDDNNAYDLHGEKRRFTIINNENYSITKPSRRELRTVVCNMKLDLHRHTLDLLQDTLLHFCVKCSAQNEKVAMIITGKGSGVIRNATEEWLQDNPAIIMKYSRIRDASGGYGSFYIWIRRNGIMLYN